MKIFHKYFLIGLFIVLGADFKAFGQFCSSQSLCNGEEIEVLSWTSDSISAHISGPNADAIILDPTKNTWEEAGFDPEVQTNIQYYLAVPGDYRHLLDKVSQTAEMYLWDYQSGTAAKRRHIIAVKEIGDGKYKILNPDFADPIAEERVLFTRIDLRTCSYWTFSGLTFLELAGSRFGYNSNHNYIDNCAFENSINLGVVRFHIMDSDSCLVQNSYFRNVQNDELGYVPCNVKDTDIGLMFDGFYPGHEYSYLQFDEAHKIEYTSDGRTEDNRVYNNHFYNISDAMGAHFRDSTALKGTIPGTHICGNYYHVDDEMRQGDFDYLENAFDFKTGSDDPDKPVVFENNKLWATVNSSHWHRILVVENLMLIRGMRLSSISMPKI